MPDMFSSYNNCFLDDKGQEEVAEGLGHCEFLLCEKAQATARPGSSQQPPHADTPSPTLAPSQGTKELGSIAEGRI